MRALAFLRRVSASLANATNAPILVLLSLASASPASAQTCGEGPAIMLRFGGEAWDPNFSAAVLGELVASAGAQGFSVCVGEAGPDNAVAHIELSHEDSSQVAVVIEVRDEVTNKRLRREVDLSSFADDSRALALAVAIDELLRASWMELAIAREPPGPEDPPSPPEVTRIVEREIAAAAPRRTEIGALVRVTGYTGGVVLLGPEFYVSHMFIDEFGAELSFGVGLGFEERSTNGTINARTIGGGLALLVRLFRADWFSLIARGGLNAWNVEFEGFAEPPALGRALSGVALAVGLGLEAALVFEWLSIRVGFDGGGTALGVGATDDGVRAYAVDGLSFGGHLSIGARL